MCFVLHLVVILLVINMAPTMSTLIVTGYLTTIFMLSRSWITNISTSKASDNALYSTSEPDSNTLFCNLDPKRPVHLINTIWSYLCFFYSPGLLHSHYCWNKLFPMICCNSPEVQFSAQGSLCLEHTWSHVGVHCRQQGLHHQLLLIILWLHWSVLGTSAWPGTTTYLHLTNIPADFWWSFSIDHRPNNQKFMHTWSFVTPSILHALGKFLFYNFIRQGCPNQALFLSSENFILLDK